MQPLIGRHQGVEIQGQIVPRRVGNDPHGRARHVVFPTKSADDSGFHLHGVGAGFRAQPSFLGGGAGHALRAVNSAGPGARSAKSRENRSVAFIRVRLAHDRSHRERGVQSTRETAGQHEPRPRGGAGKGLENRSPSPRGAHAGDEHRDAGRQMIPERNGFLGNGKADQDAAGGLGPVVRSHGHEP